MYNKYQDFPIQPLRSPSFSGCGLTEQYGMNDEAEFRHFKYLLAVVEHRGFRAAAEALHTSQPSLSRQVKEFQERFKIKLFRRLKGGRIQLTPARRSPESDSERCTGHTRPGVGGTGSHPSRRS